MIAYYFPVLDSGMVHSCDGLRLVFRFLSPGDLERFLQRVSVLEGTYYKSTRLYTYHHLFVFGGGLSSFSLGVELNSLRKEDTITGFLDFNPNKVLGKIWYGDGFLKTQDSPFDEDEEGAYTVCDVFTEVYSWLKFHCKYIEVKRFDFTVDVQEKRSKVQLFRTDQRKYSQFYKSPENFTEYLGEGNKGGRVKVYNKSLESDLDYDLTRVELTCDSFDWDTFQRRFPKVFLRRVYDLQGGVMVQLLSRLPTSDLDFYLRQMDVKTKKKYRAMLVQEPLQVSQEAFLKVIDVVKKFEWSR